MAMSSNPILPYHLAIGLNDSTVRIFDRRMITSDFPQPFSIFCPPQLKDKATRVTSVQYSSNGEEILVSYSADYVYLFSPLDRHNPLLFASHENPSYVPTEEEQEKIINDDQSGSHASLKRLRLRGDWSDTGPDARPITEEQGLPSERQSILERVSSAFTRWIGEQFLQDEASHSESDEETETNVLSQSLSSNSSPNRDGMSDSVGEANGDLDDAVGDNNLVCQSDCVDSHVKRMRTDSEATQEMDITDSSKDAEESLPIEDHCVLQGVHDSTGSLPAVLTDNGDNTDDKLEGSNSTVSDSLNNDCCIESTDIQLPSPPETNSDKPMLNSVHENLDGCHGSASEVSSEEQERQISLPSREDSMAIKIQRAFRLHVWNKARQSGNGELNEVIRPRVSMMYRGHRNARTMVSLVCLSVCLFVCPSIHPSVCLSVCMSVHLSLK